VSFYLPEKCNGLFAVNNMFGKRMMSIPFTGLESGRHTKKINLGNMPEGMYVISLFANDLEVSNIKCIKNH